MLFYENLGAYISGQRERLERLPNANIPEQGLILKVLGPAEDQDKKSNRDGHSITREVEELEIDFLGILGDRHRRAYRASTARESSSYNKGTEIREHRHLFAVSPYDCRKLSELLDVAITPDLLGVNLVIGRLDGKDYSLSQIPLGTNLLIAPEYSTELPRPHLATLVYYVQQQGCGVTGNTIAKFHGREKSFAKRFVELSKDNRGIVCSIEYPVEERAVLKKGQQVFFKFSMGKST